MSSHSPVSFSHLINEVDSTATRYGKFGAIRYFEKETMFCHDLIGYVEKLRWSVSLLFVCFYGTEFLPACISV